VNRIALKDHDRYVITFKNLKPSFFMNSDPDSRATQSDINNSNACQPDQEGYRLVRGPSSMIVPPHPPHKIILMHHPAINIQNEDGDMVSVLKHHREQFIELIEKYDMDIILTGGAYS
jgi:hypothetical protein